MTPSKIQLLGQLGKLRLSKLYYLLKKSAAAHGLPLSYVIAVASRETNCVNELGDFRGGEYHGVGIMQIDVQHDIARQARDSGSWRTDPGPLIDYGCGILRANLDAAAKVYPHNDFEQNLKVAASGYNCGLLNAYRGVKKGDSDSYTTGRDYGRDVLARMAVFRSLGGVR